jgi:hypothetical protein
MNEPREEQAPREPQAEEQQERPADAGDPGDWGNAGRWSLFGNRPDFHREETWKETAEDDNAEAQSKV